MEFVVLISLTYQLIRGYEYAYMKLGMSTTFKGLGYGSLFTLDGHQDENKRNGNNDTVYRLVEAIHLYAVNGTIVIASFDITYVSMALNLFLTSFKAFNITNHLFVASDHLGCLELLSRGAHCVQYANISIGSGPSYFNQRDYNVKACVKPRIVLDCLEAGFDVLLVDLDIVFLKNPLPSIQECKDCDFVAQIDPDAAEINSGFYLVRHTTSGLTLFRNVVERIANHPRGDQEYVNEALRDFNGTIKIQRLPPDLFPLGNSFFQFGRRQFAGDNPCGECIIVHNNYIVSLQAKIYRFKEYGMWAVDLDGYYSDRTRKYITYGNPIDFYTHDDYKDIDTESMELSSLKNALIIGRILNRTVIMPKFHCYRRSNKRVKMCHFGCRFSVRRFELFLPVLDTYRESVFLEHSLVPESTKKSVSRSYVIDGPVWQMLSRIDRNQTIGVRVLKAEGDSVSEDDVRGWFASEPSRVLNFHSLYIKVVCEDGAFRNYSNTVTDALEPSTVMQFTQI